MTSENKGETPLNLDEWIPIGTFGYRADIYAKGNQRVLVDRDFKEVICQYVVRDDLDEEECGDKLSTPLMFYEGHEKEDERKFHPQHVREGL